MFCTVYAANNCTTAAHKPVLNISLFCIEVCTKSKKVPISRSFYTRLHGNMYMCGIMLVLKEKKTENERGGGAMTRPVTPSLHHP